MNWTTPVRCPLAPIPALTEPPLMWLAVAGAERSTRPPGHDHEIAQVLLRSLRMEGYEARASYDGQAALADAHQFSPDLVIIDLGLQKLDGIDVARSLREEGDVPILMLTARDAVESRVQGLDAGAGDHLLKPFERQ